jgi:hypothetical protein
MSIRESGLRAVVAIKEFCEALKREAANSTPARAVLEVLEHHMPAIRSALDVQDEKALVRALFAVPGSARDHDAVGFRIEDHTNLAFAYENVLQAKACFIHEYYPPTFVSQADADHIIVKRSPVAPIGSWLTSIGFTDIGQDEWKFVTTSDEEKAKVFGRLRDQSVCFSTGKEWNPSEVFEYLRDKNLLSGSFTEIAWLGPEKWVVRER